MTNIEILKEIGFSIIENHGENYDEYAIYIDLNMDGKDEYDVTTFNHDTPISKIITDLVAGAHFFGQLCSNYKTYGDNADNIEIDFPQYQ